MLHAHMQVSSAAQSWILNEQAVKNLWSNKSKFSCSIPDRVDRLTAKQVSFNEPKNMQNSLQKTVTPSVAGVQRPKTVSAVPHAALKANPLLSVPRRRRSSQVANAAAPSTSLDSEVTDLLQGGYEQAYFAKRYDTLLHEDLSSHKPSQHLLVA